MINTLETDFSDYINCVYDEPQKLSPEQLHELKKAWFASAHAMLCNMKMIGEMTKDEAMQHFDYIIKQIDNYVATVINK